MRLAPVDDCLVGSKMDLESNTPFLVKKNFGATEIQTEINSVLRAGIIADSTITRSLRKRSFAHGSERPPP
jgi:hypothetical protein